MDSSDSATPSARSQRVCEHPILGRDERETNCTIWVDSRPVAAIEGEPVLAAMLAAGIAVTRRTDKLRSPRGLFCGIGLCTDCMVTIDGTPNVRACTTLVADGMKISSDAGVSAGRAGKRGRDANS